MDIVRYKDDDSYSYSDSDVESDSDSDSGADSWEEFDTKSDKRDMTVPVAMRNDPKHPITFATGSAYRSWLWRFREHLDWKARRDVTSAESMHIFLRADAEPGVPSAGVLRRFWTGSETMYFMAYMTKLMRERMLTEMQIMPREDPALRRRLRVKFVDNNTPVGYETVASEIMPFEHDVLLHVAWPYPLDESTSASQKYVLDLTRRIVNARLLNLLATHFRVAATIHFATMVGAFVGPPLVRHEVTDEVMFQAPVPNKFTVLRAETLRMYAMFDDGGQHLRSFMVAAPKIRQLVVFLFQTLYSVEMAYLALGYEFSTLRLEDITVRELSATAAPTDRAWVYARATDRTEPGENHPVNYYVMRSFGHRNRMAVITAFDLGGIDFSAQRLLHGMPEYVKARKAKAREITRRVGRDLLTSLVDFFKTAYNPDVLSQLMIGNISKVDRLDVDGFVSAAKSVLDTLTKEDADPSDWADWRIFKATLSGDKDDVKYFNVPVIERAQAVHEPVSVEYRHVMGMQPTFSEIDTMTRMTADLYNGISDFDAFMG